MHRRSRLHRSARASARARTGPQGNHRHGNGGGGGWRIHFRLRHAQHRAGQRLAGDHALDAVSGARRAGQRLPHRRGDRRQPGREAYEFCRAEAGRSGRRDRRWQADSRRSADARRITRCVAAEDSGGAARRRHAHDGRLLDESGSYVVPSGPARHAQRRGGQHCRARHRARARDQGARPRGASLDPRGPGCRAPRQEGRAAV